MLHSVRRCARPSCRLPMAPNGNRCGCTGRLRSTRSGTLTERNLENNSKTFSLLPLAFLLHFSAVPVLLQGSFRAVSGRVYSVVSVQVQSSQSYLLFHFQIIDRAISVHCQVGSSAVSVQFQGSFRSGVLCRFSAISEQSELFIISLSNH